MASSYYKPCKELTLCEELINKYWFSQQYDKCFQGHMEIAKQGYPLAECQVGYFYLEGIGVEKNLEQAFYWTQRGAQHGDRDAQMNLAEFYANGLFVEKNLDLAKEWYKKAALQNHNLAIAKCIELGIIFTP